MAKRQIKSKKGGPEQGKVGVTAPAAHPVKSSVDSSAARAGKTFNGARSMPESLPAEAAVLGSMIIDPECIGEVVERLSVDAFYRLEHHYIFNALIALYEKHKGGAIDVVLLRDELERRKQIKAVGGVEYLAKIIDSVPSSANVMYYADIVKDKQLLREIIAAAAEILDDAYDQSTETREILAEAKRKIFAVTDKNISGPAYASENFEKIIENVQGLENAGDDRSQILYHIMELETLLGRVERKGRAANRKYEARLTASLRDICRVHEPSELSEEQIKCFGHCVTALVEGWGNLNREKVGWIRSRLLDVGLTWLPVTDKAVKDISEAEHAKA